MAEFSKVPQNARKVHRFCWEGSMDTTIVKRSLVIAGRKTSVSLEDEFWKGFKEIALSRDLTLSALVDDIASGRANGNLSSAIRLFVLDHYIVMARQARHVAI